MAEDQQQPTEQKGAELMTIQRIMTASNVRESFEMMLGKKAQGFITSVLQIVAGSKDLQLCDPFTVYNAAATAAAMDLPINQNLGFAYIIGYDGKAQFQMGYKGFIQLALRTGQYNRMNCLPVYENQFKSWNALTEELDADFSIDGEGKIVGFCAYFKTVSFEKTVYWSRAKVDKHAQKFSKSYNNPKALWKKDFDSMALKTVIKHALSKWGILSIELQLAFKVDQAVIKDDKALDVEYIDNDPDEEKDPVDKAAKAADKLKKEMNNAAGKAAGDK